MLPLIPPVNGGGSDIAFYCSYSTSEIVLLARGPGLPRACTNTTDHFKFPFRQITVNKSISSSIFFFYRLETFINHFPCQIFIQNRPRFIFASLSPQTWPCTNMISWFLNHLDGKYLNCNSTCSRNGMYSVWTRSRIQTTHVIVESTKYYDSSRI